ncbi:MAG: hypothetical protein KGZ88_17350 [Methylomicrobium sp.]|nr:hypothetical protein [Methylomicrobium sp.]
MPKKKPVRLLFDAVRVKSWHRSSLDCRGPEAMSGVDVLSTANAHEGLTSP